MKRIVLVALMLVASAAIAKPSQTQFWFDPPTAHVSGVPLDPLTEIAEYRFYCDGDSETPVATISAPATTASLASGALSAGAHPCYLTAVDIWLDESAPSNTVNFTVTADPPRAPVLRSSP